MDDAMAKRQRTATATATENPTPISVAAVGCGVVWRHHLSAAGALGRMWLTVKPPWKNERMFPEKGTISKGYFHLN